MNKGWQSRIVGEGEERPDQLLANPRNWRIHPQSQQQALARLLDKVGWVQRIIVNQRTGHVVDGHLRVAMAISRNEPTVPVQYVDLSEDEEALVLASLDWSAGLAVADEEMLGEILASIEMDGVDELLADIAAGFDIDLFGDKPAEDPGAQVDRAEELREKWQTERGQLWQIGPHRLLCGDSTNADDVARLMGGERGVLCFTSPPYADQREYGEQELDPHTLAQFIIACSPFVRLFAVNLGIVRRDNAILPYWDAYIETAHDAGLKLLSWNVWDQLQVGSVGKLTAMFPIEHEFIFVFGEQPIDLVPTVPNKDAGIVDRHVSDRQPDGSVRKKKAIKIRDKREIGTVARIRPQLARDVGGHPAMFPVELPVMYLEAMPAGMNVYDPFLGSGTTMVAAEQTGRVCYGMEIEPKYVAVALQRMADMGLEPRRVE